MAVISISRREELDKAIAKGFSFVDFYTVWCGPCKMLAPLLVKVSEIANDIQFIKVDIDQVPTIASQLNIRSIPTVYLFKDGKPINFFVGYKTEPEILQFINENKK